MDELLAGTDPRDVDSFRDNLEIAAGKDPLNALEYPLPDGDVFPLGAPDGLVDLRDELQVLREGRLRGADLWHLACALYLAGEDRGALTFLSRDAPQRDLARRLGFATP